MNKLSTIKIGFFGTPDFSLQFLKYLFQENLLIKFVVSQPASKSGRGKKTKLSSVEKWSLEKKIPTFTPKKLDDPEFLEKLNKIPVDFIVVVAYGNLVNEKIINHPKHLTINVHASLLPKWRGAAPIQRSIIEGDKETGVTIMKVEEKLDSGPIIMQTKFKIFDDDTAGEVFDKMLKIGKPLLLKALNMIQKNTHNFVIQLDDEASYAKKVEKKETKIIWDQSAKIIDRKIRAFNPVPGAWTKIKSSDKRIKIFKSEVIAENKTFKKTHQCGSFTDKLKVKCGKDMIKIIELQPEGKGRMSASDFLNGLKINEFNFE